MTVLTDTTVTSPTFRGRRLRRTPALRALVRETRGALGRERSNRS